MPKRVADTSNGKFQPGLHQGVELHTVESTDDFLRTKISWMYR